MRRSFKLAPVLAVLFSVWAQACVPMSTPGGRACHRTDFAHVRFLVNQGVRAGLRNSSGDLMITPDSDPLAAIRAALQTWNGATSSTARFAPLETTGAANDSSDGQNVIVFRDTPETRSVVGSALAVTLNMVLDDGRIIDSDMLFNPEYTFSTTLAPGTYDVQSLVTHELGHALGANHSTILAAAMFQSMPSSADLESQLSADDIAFVTGTYPATGSAGAFGSIAGAVSMGGAPVRGASVVALDVNAGVAVASLSRRDGTFVISGLPPGAYVLYAEPLAGPVLPANLYISADEVDTAFSTGFLGSTGNPSTLKVAGGATVRATLSAQPAAALHIEAIGLGSPGGSGDFSQFGEGAVQIASGQSTDLMLTGPGIDESVLDDGVKLLGPGLRVRPGSIRIDPSLILNGMPIIRLTVDVSPRSSMAVGSIVVINGDHATTYTAALVIAASHPSFTAGSLVNAASYSGGGVAPGEIATLFGSGLGPPEGVQSRGFDAASGSLPVELGSVAVTFDDVPAPLFYVSAGQINLQVPFEIAGRQTTTVVVTSAGIPSDRIEVPVVTAHPGIFVRNGTSQAIAVNQDGSINSASQPAPSASVITLFATGEGVVNPPVKTGRPAPRSALSFASSTTATIGGVASKVCFAGMTPGFVGLMQINVEVPQGIAPGGAVRVQISLGGVTSQGNATIAVK